MYKFEYLIIPKLVLDDKRLDWPSIALAAFFHDTHIPEKPIYIDNQFLSEVARVSIRNMQIRLNLLEEYGYIERIYENNLRFIKWVK